MRSLLFMIALLTASTNSIAAAPLEEDAIYSKSKWTRSHAQTLAKEASRLIHLYGYRCDSVSSISHSTLSLIFSVTCNGFRYKYEVEDRGGRWEVRLK